MARVQGTAIDSANQVTATVESPQNSVITSDQCKMLMALLSTQMAQASVREPDATATTSGAILNVCLNINSANYLKISFGIHTQANEVD